MSQILDDLRTICAERGINPSTLSRMTGINGRTVPLYTCQRWLAGERSAALESIETIAAALGLPAPRLTP